MTQKPRHSIQKVVVLCNIPHTIIEGTCILCERDHAVNMLDVMEEAKAVLTKILASEVDGSYIAGSKWWKEAETVLAKMESEP